MSAFTGGDYADASDRRKNISGKLQDHLMKIAEEGG